MTIHWQLGKKNCVLSTQLKGKKLFIDGYNLLITIESALSGGFIFVGRDGCYRDLASVHGTYRRVEETLPAIMTIGKSLMELGVEGVQWYFDAPISNSGRLKVYVHELAVQTRLDLGHRIGQ